MNGSFGFRKFNVKKAIGSALSVLALSGVAATVLAPVTFAQKSPELPQNVQSKAASGSKGMSTTSVSPSVEVLLDSAADDAWFIEGDMRMSVKTGFPAAIYRPDFPVTGSDPESQSRGYLISKRDLLGLTLDDIDNLRLHAIRRDEAGVTVRLRQTWQGLAVNKNAEITVHISPKKFVDFVMNGFQYGIALEDVKPAFSPEFARQIATNRLSIREESLKDETTELMVLRHQDRDFLVFRVNFMSSELIGEWEAFVDAKSGELLKLEDVAVYHRAKHDRIKRSAETGQALLVDGTGNVFDPDPLTTALASYGGSYVDGSDANAAVLTAQLKSVTLPDITLNAGTYSLVGPYASIADFEAPNKGLFTQASPTFAFDRNADAFEAVNTYYHIDAQMRYLNVTLGLAIMPYQYTGGVRFDPSGLNGADNSHYIGSTGRIAFGEGGVDDAEDADVIIHELGHGLHDWVTSGGLSQVDGLSEGTGDYIAGSYSRAKGYWTSAQTAYNWTFNWDGHNPFWGGRVLNYGAAYPGGLVNQIHTDGQIWATANMKIWDDIGAQKADKAFWSGLALTNGSTNQNDAANAVMTAASNLGYTIGERTAMRNRYVAAGYTIPLIPTAANVEVAGVIRTASGRGVEGAIVTLTDVNGNPVSVRANQLGSFSFENVPAGQTYVISVRSKEFRFAAQSLTVDDNVIDLVLTAID